MDYDKTMKYLSQDIIYFNHNQGITPEKLRSNPILNSQINILGTSRAHNGIEFVSLAEDKNYPFLFMQGHPEKSQFEHKNIKYRFLPRSKDVIDVTSGFIKSFIEANRVTRNYEIELDMRAKHFQAFRFVLFPTFVSIYEYVYLFSDMKDCLSYCGRKISRN